jgi:hypothetical protein
MTDGPLQQHDLISAVWVKLQRYYSARLDSLRLRNDGDLTTEETIRLRARIAECKHFLALAEELTPEQVADE